MRLKHSARWRTDQGVLDVSVDGAGAVAGCEFCAGVDGVADPGSVDAGVLGGKVNGDAGCVAGATGIVVSDCLINEPPGFVRCECSTARINVVANNEQAHQIVRRTKAVVVPAPKTVSVMPPPNAAPTPCSDDFCINTSTIKNSPTITWSAVSIPIRMLMIS
ncbi:MAG TPA: hypothetical protein VLZ30_11100 [Verrucomicrobiae bacterium]|nr:hypothetical protein [Verrucomicrobiae bacterium]